MNTAAWPMGVVGDHLLPRTEVPVANRAARGDPLLRDQLSSLQGLLVLSMLMTESEDVRQILHLAATSVPSLGCCHLGGVHLSDSGWQTAAPPYTEPEVRAAVDAQLGLLGVGGGMLAVPNEQWAWAFPLRGLEGSIGHLVVAAPRQPSASEQFLLRVLAQQTGVALVNARLHAKERATAEQLSAANTALAQTVRALERSTAIHDQLTRVAVGGEGQEGIARAVHKLTGYPVAVEDRYGNLRAWAGPDRPEPYPKDPQARREQMLRRALREGRPIREAGRLVAIARPREDVLGVLVLIDPGRSAGEQELVALEHGATVLAMELARLRSLADTELRVRSELVDHLLGGADEEGALALAQTLDYDLEQPHQVLVVEGRGRRRDEEAFFHAVRRAARDVGAGVLLVSRGRAVVLLSRAKAPFDRLRCAVLAELGGGTCRMGVGSVCERPGDFPRSFREAQFALKMQVVAKGAAQVVEFERLGVYRLLSEVQDTVGIERFVRSWLGALLDYDSRKRSDLVATLTEYLERGGSYDNAAQSLSVHRNTLKYRLQRIREISGHDLSCPDTRFNLQLATRAWQTLIGLRGRCCGSGR
ncbi:MAG TPA: helix-turn-helix domain-containing protein [Pseudonocardiaceae bacterium]|jgi:DNA-binding PucR family transcriptional regulator|nr:helix-turn-helix domain-containing protein [Pseudonocardiaceae bacterium]